MIVGRVAIATRIPSRLLIIMNASCSRHHLGVRGFWTVNIVASFVVKRFVVATRGYQKYNLRFSESKCHDSFFPFSRAHARSTEHGAWSMEHGARSMEHGAWSTEHGAWSTEHGAWSMEHAYRKTILLFDHCIILRHKAGVLDIHPPSCAACCHALVQKREHFTQGGWGKGVGGRGSVAIFFYARARTYARKGFGVRGRGSEQGVGVGVWADLEPGGRAGARGIIHICPLFLCKKLQNQKIFLDLTFEMIYNKMMIGGAT